MINITVTGRLTADAKFTGGVDKPYMTFTLAGKKKNGDTEFFNCIRSVREEPKNFQSFKKGAMVSASGEPSINVYQPKEGDKKFNFNLDVTSVQVQSLAAETTE